MSSLYSEDGSADVPNECREKLMLKRVLGLLGVAAVVFTSGALAQASPAKSKEPVSNGRTLSEWVADLKALAPASRNAAAYEIAGMGPAAVSAVPALIEALDDPSAAVRYPVTVALREMGPSAKAAVPRLQQMMEEEINDEVAASARRALKRIQPDAVPSQ
jgi:HEAT repeat protein